MNKGSEESLLNYQKYYFSSAIEEKFKNKNQMSTNYGQLKEKSKAET